MAENTNGSRITTEFNIALLAFASVYGVIRFLASDKVKGMSVDGIILGTVVDFARVLICLFIAAYFVKEFWGRLIADVWKLRPLEYKEAIAIVLMFGLLFG